MHFSWQRRTLKLIAIHLITLHNILEYMQIAIIKTKASDSGQSQNFCPQLYIIISTSPKSGWFQKPCLLPSLSPGPGRHSGSTGERGITGPPGIGLGLAVCLLRGGPPQLCCLEGLGRPQPSRVQAEDAVNLSNDPQNRNTSQHKPYELGVSLQVKVRGWMDATHFDSRPDYLGIRFPPFKFQCCY